MAVVDQAEVFTTCAATVGTAVYRASTAQTPPLVARLLSEAGARRVAIQSSAAAAFPTLADHLQRQGFLLAPADAPPAALAMYDAGISLAAFAVAETGSFALDNRLTFDRLAAMLPPVHVVLVHTRDLLATLDEAGERLRAWTTGESGATYLSLVTGASRTADIERVLTVGVQGPRVLCGILVDETGGPAA